MLVMAVCSLKPKLIGRTINTADAACRLFIVEKVYGCVSPRCDAGLFAAHASNLGYTPVLFHSYGADRTAVYHTNVMMGVQSTTAVICAESITDEAERERVLRTLQETGHEVVEVTQAQMAAFCGNVLELQNSDGERFLAMSQTAYDNFTDDQRAILGKDKTLLPFDVSTIETVGGGSVRCMLGEVFLPRKQAKAPMKTSNEAAKALTLAQATPLAAETAPVR